MNVYLTYCSRANTDAFLAFLGKMKQLCDEMQCPNICFVGDFNIGVTIAFGGLLVDFCMENDFIISDLCNTSPRHIYTHYWCAQHNFLEWSFCLICCNASSSV